MLFISTVLVDKKLWYFFFLLSGKIFLPPNTMEKHWDSLQKEQRKHTQNSEDPAYLTCPVCSHVLSCGGMSKHCEGPLIFSLLQPPISIAWFFPDLFSIDWAPVPFPVFLSIAWTMISVSPEEWAAWGGWVYRPSWHWRHFDTSLLFWAYHV